MEHKTSIKIVTLFLGGYKSKSLSFDLQERKISFIHFLQEKKLFLNCFGIVVHDNMEMFSGNKYRKLFFGC